MTEAVSFGQPQDVGMGIRRLGLDSSQQEIWALGATNQVFLLKQAFFLSDKQMNK